MPNNNDQPDLNLPPTFDNPDSDQGSSSQGNDTQTTNNADDFFPKDDGQDTGPKIPSPPDPRPMPEPDTDRPKPEPKQESQNIPSFPPAHLTQKPEPAPPASISSLHRGGDHEPPKIKPASLSGIEHKPKPVSSILILALAGLAILAIALTAFFFLQNNILKQQINVIQSTEEGRKVNPTTTPTEEATPTSTTSASPAPTEAAVTLSAMSDLGKIIDIAQQKYPSAQLLMITTDNLLTLDKNVYKYWFRQGPGTGSYFYIQYSRTNEPQLYTNATVSPDNNIPDLTPLFKDGQLGISDIDAHAVAWSEAISPVVTDTTPSNVKAKFIRTTPVDSADSEPVNIWQLTYSFPTSSGRPNIVIQINANTNEVIFSNL